MAKTQQGIRPPNMKVAKIGLRGTAPLVGNKFSGEARELMRQQQEEGHVAKKGRKREPKDFNKLREEATHRLEDGSCGIPATAFRQALISACRIVGFRMSLAKLSLFIEADGFDTDDHCPLVRFTKGGEPEHFEACVRNKTGVADIRARPMWKPGWEAVLRVKYDADQFSEQDVRTLLMRVGTQVGIGAGRPDSKESAGQGWGTFEIFDVVEG